MKFALIVKTPFVSSYSALKFLETAINLKHSIVAVFFDQQGVSIANTFINLPNDEINIQQNWQVLAKEFSIPLIVCSTSALRYGIKLDQLAEQFTIGSFGQLIEILVTVDKIVIFK